MKRPLPKLDYALKTEKVRFGELELSIQLLASLDQTIDQVFEVLQKEGTPERLEELCPYFGVIWPSAIALTESIAALSSPAGENPVKILEIGCGLALPSLIAAQKGFQVTATDFHPEVETFLQRNLQLNGIQNVRYQPIDWQAVNELPPAMAGGFDWIIGSDILYERKHPEIVAATIDRLLRPGGTAIITDPVRPYLQPFYDIMNQLGFTAATQIFRVTREGQLKEIFVLTFRRSGMLSV